VAGQPIKEMIASLFNLAGPDLIILFIIGMPLAFVIWMIVDCVKYETDTGNLKLIWVLIILLLPLGSFVYLFARKIGRKPAPPNSQSPTLPP
jgi:hypothetical protein